MRTVTTTFNVYEYGELLDRAKERARQDHVEAVGYARGEEAMDSIKALALHFGGKMVDWSIDWGNASRSSAEFSMPEMAEKEIREKLKTLGSFNKRTLKGRGDCKLTGVSFDESAIDGFRWAFHRRNERDLNLLMQAGFESWLKDVQSDFEYQYSDEGLKENSEANGYEYTQEGKLI